MPCTTPPRICSSTSCGLITVPQSSTHQCLSRVTKPDLDVDLEVLAWMPLVNANGQARGA